MKDFDDKVNKENGTLQKKGDKYIEEARKIRSEDRNSLEVLYAHI
jgi:hypothetical protein